MVGQQHDLAVELALEMAKPRTREPEHGSVARANKGLIVYCGHCHGWYPVEGADEDHALLAHERLEHDRAM